MSDGTLFKTLEGHTHHVLGVAWRLDGRSLASAGADSVVKVWNAKTGDQIVTVQGFNKEVTGVQFVAETDQAIATSGSKLVRMFNSANGGTMRDLAEVPISYRASPSPPMDNLSLRVAKMVSFECGESIMHRSCTIR